MVIFNPGFLHWLIIVINNEHTKFQVSMFFPKEIRNLEMSQNRPKMYRFGKDVVLIIIIVQIIIAANFLHVYVCRELDTKNYVGSTDHPVSWNVDAWICQSAQPSPERGITFSTYSDFPLYSMYSVFLCTYIIYPLIYFSILF